eukprot:scaffold86565_cov54-Phaeocystis_antarctica.AAC.1
MSRLIASRMVFRAQGESPASCAPSPSEAGPGFRLGFRAGAGIRFRIPLTGGHQIRADASYTLIDSGE